MKLPSRLMNINQFFYFTIFLLLITGIYPQQSQARRNLPIYFSHFLPNNHFVYQELLLPWLNEIKKSITTPIIVYDKSNDLSKSEKQIQYLLNGELDIIYGIINSPNNIMPKASIMHMPMMGRTSRSATNVLWWLYDNKKLDSIFYNDMVLLSLHCNYPSGIFSTKFPILSPKYMSANPIRSPHPFTSIIIKEYNGIPKYIPLPELRNQLNNNKVYATISEWNTIKQYKLNTIFEYYTQIPLYNTCVFLGANKKFFNSLSKKDQLVITSHSAKIFARQAYELWDKKTFDNKNYITSQGNDRDSIEILEYKSERIDMNLWTQLLERTHQIILSKYYYTLAIKDIFKIYKLAKQQVEKEDAKIN